jgi:hypothetical protein
MGVLILSLLVPLASPPPHADDARKPDSKAFHVPYRLTGTNHVLVRVKIDGRGPYHFILDTGAPALFVAKSVCAKHGVKANRDGWGTFERFEIEGGVVLKEFKGRVEDPFQIEGMNSMGLAGVQLHGIIGYTVLARYRLEFDFTKHKMGWQPLAFDPPAPFGLGPQPASEASAFGPMVKVFSAFLGKKPPTEISLRGFLGLRLADDDYGVAVKAVLPGSPAATAGLKPDDRITQFQSRGVKTAAAVYRAASKLAPDETIKLSIVRAGVARVLEVKAGKGL